jgi:hypothetical protein
MVDPGADVLWESVATTISAAGTEELQPRTDDDWKNVHRNAVILVEATKVDQPTSSPESNSDPEHESEVPARPYGTCYNAIWLVCENDAG